MSILSVPLRDPCKKLVQLNPLSSLSFTNSQYHIRPSRGTHFDDVIFLRFGGAGSMRCKYDHQIRIASGPKVHGGSRG